MRAPPRGRLPRQRIRRGVQLAFAALFLGAPFANAAGVTWLFATGLSTRVGSVELLEPVSALSVMLASRELVPRVLLAAAPLTLLLAVLGSVFCGWACPWGLVSELLDRLRAPVLRRRWREGAPRRARVVRLVALAVVLAGGAVSAWPLAALLAGPRIGTAFALELAALETLSSTTCMVCVDVCPAHTLRLLGPGSTEHR